MTKSSTGDLDGDAMLRQVHAAIFIGDGKVGGNPGLVEAVNRVTADVAVIKAGTSRADERVWALSVGAAGGFIAAWLKSLFTPGAGS